MHWKRTLRIDPEPFKRPLDPAVAFLLKRGKILLSFCPGCEISRDRDFRY
ncbi:hypothetical protein [Desulfonatronovibrio hydrogenovorans]|nr:hypothetical protein [Desulfonatronovibrio hydrogenovorans]